MAATEQPSRGRPPQRAMARMVRLLAVLHYVGSDGVSAERLIQVGEYGASDPNSQLARDLRELRERGWIIENTAGPGEGARYRMSTADNRLTVHLEPGQTAALHRALLVMGRPEMAQGLGVPDSQQRRPPETKVHVQGVEGRELVLAIEACNAKAMLKFIYKGTMRLVHPQRVRFENRCWYLSAIEEPDGPLKNFRVSRMTQVRLERPGTAISVPVPEDLTLHPLLWRLDPEAQVVLRVPLQYEADVVRLLRSPDTRVEDEEGCLHLTYSVTNRKGFRARLYQLGSRVHVVGPQAFRDEIISELNQLLGED